MKKIIITAIMCFGIAIGGSTFAVVQYVSPTTPTKPIRTKQIEIINKEETSSIEEKMPSLDRVVSSLEDKTATTSCSTLGIEDRLDLIEKRLDLLENKE